MKGLLRFAKKHPYLFMLMIFPVIPFGLMMIQVGIARLLGFMHTGIDSFQDSTKAIAVLLYLFILWRFDWLRPAGFQTAGKLKAWLVMAGASILELALIISASNGRFEWQDLGVMADPAAYLLVGLFEETAFRGLILFTFLHRWGDRRGGLWKSVLVSSTVFGIGHMMSILNGNTLIGALYQVGSCAISGILWCRPGIVCWQHLVGGCGAFPGGCDWEWQPGHGPRCYLG